MRVWGAAVSAGHLFLGGLGWLVLGVAPWFFAGCAVVTLFVALVAAPMMRTPPPRSDDDDGGGDGGGGGPSGPDGGDPPWWPEFERDFRAYAEQRRRARF
jgi:hypothetical protein